VDAVEGALGVQDPGLDGADADVHVLGKAACRSECQQQGAGETSGREGNKEEARRTKNRSGTDAMSNAHGCHVEGLSSRSGVSVR
jgi:hypothetical protein